MRQSADIDNGLCPFRVLHISPPLCDGTGGGKVQEGIKRLDILPEHQLDVYCGLAWLARSCNSEPSHAEIQGGDTENEPRIPTPLVGVVVCVDELVLAEHEFFELTSHYDGLYGVYVYSCYGDSGSVQRAIAHGATGELTDEVLSELRLAIDESLNPTESKSADKVTITKDVTNESLPNEAEEATATMPKLAIPKATQPVTATESDQERIEDEHIEDDDMIGPVQVPWDRRPAPPQRSAPPQQPAASPSPSSETVNPNRANGNSERKKSPYGGRPKRQPLLSPEELRALIGEIEKKEPLEDHPQGDHESA